MICLILESIIVNLLLSTQFAIDKPETTTVVSHSPRQNKTTIKVIQDSNFIHHLMKTVAAVKMTKATMKIVTIKKQYYILPRTTGNQRTTDNIG